MQRSIALGLGTMLVALAARSAQAQYPAYPQSYPNPYAYQRPMAYPPMPNPAMQYPPMQYPPVMQYPPMQYPPVQYPQMQYPGYGVPGYPQMPQQPVMMMPVPVSVTRVVPMQGPVETMPSGGPLTPEALAAPSVVGPSSTVVVQPAPSSTPATTPAQTIVPTAAADAPHVTPTPTAAAHPAAAETPHTTKEETKGWFRRAHDYLCGPKFQMDGH